jgi:hypothetical protein
MEGNCEGRRNYCVGSLQERALEDMTAGGGRELPPDPLQAALHLPYHLRASQGAKPKQEITGASVRFRCVWRDRDARNLVDFDPNSMQSRGGSREGTNSPCCSHWRPWPDRGREGRGSDERCPENDLATAKPTRSFCQLRWTRKLKPAFPAR